jgi:ubiquinone/menaquinone biosynthesis C-methylase UbiE
MAQITSGFRKILGLPAAYNIFQSFLGARKARQFYVDNYVNPESKHKILDIGCGTSEILAVLPEDVEYVGFDLSQEYIDAARERFGVRGKWFCSPASAIDIQKLNYFDIVLANGILHHIEDSEASYLIETAFKALKSGGRFVCIESAFTPDQSQISRLIISKDRGQNVRSPNGYAKLLHPYFSSVSTHVHHDLLRIPYTHVILVGTKGC